MDNHCSPVGVYDKISGRESVTSRIPKRKQPIKEVAVSKHDSSRTQRSNLEAKSWDVFGDGTLEQRFWARVKKTDGCWEWTGPLCGTTPKYGVISVNGKSRRAHRVSWMLANGPIINKLFVCHRCNNSACVRPDHLYLGTPLDNTNDAINAGTFVANANKKLSLEVAEQIRQRASNGESGTALAREYGIARGTLHSLLIGETWRSVRSDDYKISADFNAGFCESINNQAMDKSKSEHWLAGWNCGHQYRSEKNKHLKEYMSSIAKKPLAQAMLEERGKR